MQVRVKENPEDFGKCGCGRSPSGYCIGWHGLTITLLMVAMEKPKGKNERLDIGA